MGVGIEGVGPLLPMLGVAPGSLVRRDVGIRDIAERHGSHLCLAHRRRRGCLRRVPVGKRIAPLSHHVVQPPRLHPRIGQRHGAEPLAAPRPISRILPSLV